MDCFALVFQLCHTFANIQYVTSEEEKSETHPVKMHIVFQYIWMQANRISQQEDPFLTPRMIPSFDWLYSINARSKFLFDRSIIPQHTLFSLFLAVSHYSEVFFCVHIFPFNDSRCLCCFLLFPIILKYFRVRIVFHLRTRLVPISPMHPQEHPRVPVDAPPRLRIPGVS